MNRIFLISIFCLIGALLTGCSLTNSAPKTPLTFSLPSTPIFQRVVSVPYLVTASSSTADSTPANVIDGDIESIWNAGAGPEQWIQIDTGSPRSLRAIRLAVSQYPEGETVHQIWVGADAVSMFQVHEFAGFTRDSDVLEFIADGPLENIRFIKIVTTQSSSWVAWREIEILAP
jgi:hypothetical protein